MGLDIVIFMLIILNSVITTSAIEYLSYKEANKALKPVDSAQSFDLTPQPNSLPNKYSLYWLLAVVLVFLTYVETIFLVYKLKLVKTNKLAPKQTATPETETEVVRMRANEHSDISQAKKQKGSNGEAYTLLANMSHELRSPLNSILGFAQIIEQSSTTQSELENIAIIHRSGERLLSIINDVVDLAKIETDRLTLEDNNLDFRAWLDNLEQSLKSQAKDRNWKFSSIERGELPQYIRIDERRLRQIIGNLIEYCLKVPSEKNTIVFTVSSQGQIQKQHKSSNNMHELYFEVKNYLNLSKSHWNSSFIKSG